MWWNRGRPGPGRGREEDHRWPRWTGLLAIAALSGLLFMYVSYVGVWGALGHLVPLTVPTTSAPPAQESQAEPAQPTAMPELTSRVNVLLLGIDRRGTEASRTDTMILLSLDPSTKTASMLSIPRDLWVTLPDLYVQERINAAFTYGEVRSDLGGGAAYAKKTVQETLGVPVHYYIEVDFGGFERAIDQVGGIDIDVPQEINDPAYPTPDGGTTTLHIPAGRQHMDGALALKYARTRHDPDGDFSRARRQQQVIMALRDKVVGLHFSLTRIPGLLQTLGQSVSTDIPMSQIYAMAMTAQEVQTENIHRGLIDTTMVSFARTSQGWAVLLPNYDRIQALAAELFGSSTASTGTDQEPLGNYGLLAQDNARIEVLNGTTQQGLAEQAAANLRAAGYYVKQTAEANRKDIAQTTIVYYYSGRPYTLASLQAYLSVADAQVSRQSATERDVDIRIILGADAIGKPTPTPPW